MMYSRRCISHIFLLPRITCLSRMDFGGARFTFMTGFGKWTSPGATADDVQQQHPLGHFVLLIWIMSNWSSSSVSILVSDDHILSCSVWSRNKRIVVRSASSTGARSAVIIIVSVSSSIIESLNSSPLFLLMFSSINSIIVFVHSRYNTK